MERSAPLRAIIAVIGGLVLLRVHSYGAAGWTGSFWKFVRFLSLGLASPHLVYSPARRVVVSPFPLSRQVLRIVVSVAVILITWTVAGRSIVRPMVQNSWMLNHLVLAAAFTIIMTAFGQCATVSWELQGTANKVLVDRIYLSRTPAEFWRRWSWPMHLWLYRHVYIPAGGKRHHVRATLAAFLASGLLHELLAAIVIGRVTGHQTLFFMLSAAGVLASPVLEKLSAHGALLENVSRLLTLFFLIFTASFMFATLHYITPLYVKHIWILW